MFMPQHVYTVSFQTPRLEVPKFIIENLRLALRSACHCPAPPEAHGSAHARIRSRRCVSIPPLGFQLKA